MIHTKKNEEYPTLKDCVEYLRSCGIERPIYCGVGVHAPEDVRLVREAGGGCSVRWQYNSKTS